MKQVQLVLLSVTLLFITLPQSEALKWNPRLSKRQDNKPCSWPPKPQPLPNPLPAKLTEAFQKAETQAQQILKQQGTPGAHIQVVYDQSILWSYGYGTVNLSTPDATPTANTIFRIASISKVFASLMLFILRDEGVLDLDDPVSKYNPNFYLKYGYNDIGRGITFRNLATHTAGLPREVPCVDFWACNFTTQQIFDRLHDMNAIFPPDTMPIYSNLGFGTLGRVMEEAAGQVYEDLVHEKIVLPLRLNGTGFKFTPDVMKRLAVGYDSNGNVDPYYAGDVGWGAASGQMYSTSNDLSKIIMLLFRDYAPKNSDTQILDGQSIREMLHPIYYLNNGRQDGFGIPWEMEYYGGYMVRTKRGDINGYASEIIMVPELKLGIIVLVNCIEEAAPVAVPIADSIIIPAFDAVLRELQKPPVLPPNWKLYLGTYVNDAISSSITISHSDNQLFLTSDWVTGNVPLEWIRDTTWRMLPPSNDPDNCLEQEVEVLFQLLEFQLEDNKVTAVTVPGLMYGLTWTRK